MILLISKKNKKIEYEAQKYYSKATEEYYYYRTKFYIYRGKANTNKTTLVSIGRRSGKSFTNDLMQAWTKEKLEQYWHVVDTDSDNIELLEALFADLSRFRREGASPSGKSLGTPREALRAGD